MTLREPLCGARISNKGGTTVLRAFYRRGDGAATRTDDIEVLRSALADPSGLLWVDIQVTDNDRDGAILRDLFRFHPLTIEDCLSPQVDPAKIDDHGDYIFIVVQALCEYQRDGELGPVETDFYLGPNYVVSCHREPVAAIEHFQARCESDEFVLRHSADWLLHSLLDALVDEYLPCVDAMDDALDDLEEQVLHRPERSILQRLLVLKRNMLRLRRAILPMRDIMNRLSRGEFPKLIHEETAIYYRDIYDHLVRIEYLVEALRDLADGALNTYLSAVSNRLSEIMKVLTAAAAVFLPLTLISGIYGMNFASEGVWPPLDSNWGFGALIGFMVATAAGLLAYFRYRRWI
jgi:magnesium transporter